MKHYEYYNILKQQLDSQVFDEAVNIELAAVECSKSIMKKRIIHVFGCGHSQMFGMEIFYRAGGLVPVNAILIPQLSLSPKAKLSTIQERIENYSNKYLRLLSTSDEDTMIIVSVSGRNACVIDMALEAKKIGMKVIALVSKKFAENVKSRHSSNKNLKDIADIVIDIKCELGDACLSIDGLDEKVNGTSTILGMTVMNLITARAIELCVEKNFIPPVFVSSNLDRGDKINDIHIKNYGNLIECL